MSLLHGSNAHCKNLLFYGNVVYTRLYWHCSSTHIWGAMRGGLQKHSCQKSRVCNVSLLLPDKATETHTETNIKCILPQRDHFFPCNFKQWAFSLSASKNNDLHDRSKSISTVMPINTLNSYVIIIKKKDGNKNDDNSNQLILNSRGRESKHVS